MNIRMLLRQLGCTIVIQLLMVARCQLNQACAYILKYIVNNTGVNLAASYFYTCSLFSRRISAFISFKHLAMSYMQYNKITK